MAKNNQKPKTRVTRQAQLEAMKNELLKMIPTQNLLCSIDYQNDDTHVRVLAHPCGAYITTQEKLAILIALDVAEERGKFYEDAIDLVDAIKESVAIALSTEIKGIQKHIEELRFVGENESKNPQDNRLTRTMAKTIQTLANTIKMMKEAEAFDDHEDRYKKDKQITLDYIR